MAANIYVRDTPGSVPGGPGMTRATGRGLIQATGLGGHIRSGWRAVTGNNIKHGFRLDTGKNPYTVPLLSAKSRHMFLLSGAG